MNDLVAFENQTNIITNQATDICALPVVQEGYKISGKPANLVYMNLQSMALTRVRKHYMNVDPKDILMRRIIARVKLIIAECFKQKYEYRERRIAYDHLKAINERVADFFRREVNDIKKELVGINRELI